MNIEEGWVFYTADFSLNPGRVMLRRDSAGYELWHRMTQEDKEDIDGPPLFAVGTGSSFEEALTNANLVAAHALPIKENV